MKNIALIRFEGFELDPQARQLRRGGHPVPLSAKTFDLLLYLALHARQVVTKDELLTAVWPGSFVEESNLAQHIFLLRKAIASHGCAERIVVTVPGRGYQFVSETIQTPVERDTEKATPASPAAHPQGLTVSSVRSVTRLVVDEAIEHEELGDNRREDAALGKPGATRRRRLVLLAGIGAVGLLVSTAFLAYRRWLQPPPAGPIVLVLSSIQNTTGDSDFDRTLNQALQIDLEQSPFLNLMPRSTIRETLLEMRQKAADDLPPGLAMEVCQRNNAQASLSGTISRLGGRYLLILNAESCVSGKHLAGYKEQASSKEAVLSVLDRAAGHMRQQLGESSSSREQYRIPIAQATTPSFAALLAYTRAGESFRRGDMKASQSLLERSIQLDPNFASAYRILASSYYNLGDYGQAASLYTKAFDLRERTTERERLGIEVMYYGYARNDYEESIRRTRQFLAIYPNVANSWVSLCNLFDRLGQYGQAIDAANHAIHLDPHSGVAAVELMRANMRLGRFEQAKATAKAAIADGKDHWDIHSMLFQIAFAERDTEAIRSEGEWGLTHQHANISLADLAMAAAAGGRLHEAIEDFSRSRNEALRNGEKDFANDSLLSLAEVESELEMPALALAALKRVGEQGGDPATAGRLAKLRAENGDLAAARQFLSKAQSPGSTNTLNNRIYLPMVQAILSLREGKPRQALEQLEPARSYELSGYEILFLRAQAEMEAGMPGAAAADYRLILANRGIDPISPLYSLAHLRLARLLAARQQYGAARAEYQAFLEAWKECDPALAPARQARSEMQSLNARN